MQQLQPQIAELLRTCIHPPALRLQVAHVKFIDISRDQTEHNDAVTDSLTRSIDSACIYATKLLLSDGHLMIQSLLHRKLSTLGDVAGVSIGDLVEIKSFRVKRSPRVRGSGHVIYLAIDDCHLLKEGSPSEYARSETILRGKRKRSDSKDHENRPTILSSDSEGEETFYSAEDSIQGPSKRLRRTTPDNLPRDFKEQKMDVRMAPKTTILKSPKRVSFTSSIDLAVNEPVAQRSASAGAGKVRVGEKGSSVLAPENCVSQAGLKLQAPRSHDKDDEDDFFESTQTSQSIIDQRRQALRSLDQNIPSKVVLPESKIQPSNSHHNSIQQVSPRPQQIPKPDSQSSSTVVLQPSPPFHTLRSLRNPATNKPLPSKSYTLTTLGFITWTGSSLIHRPGSPFPPKRHLKIVDPSLSISRPPSRGEATSTQNIAPLDNNIPVFKSQNSFQEAITLAVYLDAANFRPPSGTLALFRGVVMQRLYNGDIILNVYARLKEVRIDSGNVVNEIAKEPLHKNDNSNEHHQKNHELDNHWFITDHDKIRSLGYGSRLDYYLDWWKNRDV